MELIKVEVLAKSPIETKGNFKLQHYTLKCSDDVIIATKLCSIDKDYVDNMDKHINVGDIGNARVDFALNEYKGKKYQGIKLYNFDVVKERDRKVEAKTNQKHSEAVDDLPF